MNSKKWTVFKFWKMIEKFLAKNWSLNYSRFINPLSFPMKDWCIWMINSLYKHWVDLILLSLGWNVLRCRSVEKCDDTRIFEQSEVLNEGSYLLIHMTILIEFFSGHLGKWIV